MQSHLTEAEFADRLNADEDVRALFQGMLSQYQEGKLNAQDYAGLQAQFSDRGYALNFLGDPHAQSNNMVFKLSDQNSDQSVILHISIKDDSEEALRKAIRGMDPLPSWANHEYADFSSEVKDDVRGTSDTYHLRVVKTCVPLTQKIKDMQQLSDVDKIQFSQDTVGKMSNFFDDVERFNSFFTDMKEGNILFDASNSLQIVDTKSLVNAGNLRGVKEYQFAADTTDGYISPVFQAEGIKFPKETGASEMQARWQQEYSYQTGIILHRMLTGNESHSEPVKDNNGISKINFKFHHPVFESKQGQQLQVLIQALTHDDPAKRPSIHAAVKSLKKIATSAAKTIGKDAEKLKKLNPEVRGLKGMDKPAALRQALLDMEKDKPGSLLKEYKEVVLDKAYSTFVRNLMTRDEDITEAARIKEKAFELEAKLHAQGGKKHSAPAALEGVSTKQLNRLLGGGRKSLSRSIGSARSLKENESSVRRSQSNDSAFPGVRVHTPESGLPENEKPKSAFPGVDLHTEQSGLPKAKSESSEPDQKEKQDQGRTTPGFGRSSGGDGNN